MQTVISVAPAIEPVTLAEFKNHLRLESTDFADHLEQYISIAPGAHVVAAAYSLVGTGRDVLGHRALARLTSGTNGSNGTVDAKIQESDNNSAYTDWSGGAFTQVTEANDNAVQEIEYSGVKQYIRVVATVATATCSFGASIEVEEATHSDDTMLGNLITLARQYAEFVTGRALITQTWNGYLNCFPSGVDYIQIPYPPLQSITSIKYRDADWAEAADWETWSDDEYIVDSNRYIGRVVLAYGESWPTFTEYPVDPIHIVFVCGYGTTAVSVPIKIRQAILMYAATLYEVREEISTGLAINKVPTPLTVDNLLRQYQIEP